MTHKYNLEYYNRLSRGAIQSAREVYAELNRHIEFTTVVDIGCGIGCWNNGNEYYGGVDYNVPLKNLLFPLSTYRDCDFEREIFNLPFKHDLCLCLEVYEHISKRRSDVLVKMLCNLSNQILFSAAIPGQGGTGHINEKWQSWWANMFASNGFYPYKVDLRKVLFHNSRVEVWYRNNMILYTKKKFKIDYELDFVHPEMFTACVNHWKSFKKFS